MPELICEVAPIAVADNDVDPGRFRSLGVKPNRWIASLTIVHTEFFWLMIGNEVNACQTGCAHRLYYGRGV
jgi:hypothetical protein